MNLSDLRGTHVEVTEVGPRDGLQNETISVSTRDKIAFVDALSQCGLGRIEVASFVSPAWVPQMADAAEVFTGIARVLGVTYAALTPNLKGLDRAMAAKADEVAIVTAATDTFSRKNTHGSLDDSLLHCTAVARRALDHGLRVRAYVSVAFGCPYEGDVPPAIVVTLTQRLLDMGAYEVAISDTVGVAHPGQVAALLDHLLNSTPSAQLALHVHDTRGTALANILTGLLAGLTRFDASAGGIGGCPYAPGASGNVAIDDLIYVLNGLGIETGVSLQGLAQASALIERCLGHPVPSRYVQAERASRRTPP